MQLKPLSQQTPPWPDALVTERVVQAPTWLGSVGAQTHPNGSAEQFIAVPPPASSAPPPSPTELVLLVLLLPSKAPLPCCRKQPAAATDASRIAASEEPFITWRRKKRISKVAAHP